MYETFECPYKMSISLNVLDHLDLKLYSNTPAVVTEVITNAWDADATESIQQTLTSLQSRAWLENSQTDAELGCLRTANILLY